MRRRRKFPAATAARLAARAGLAALILAGGCSSEQARERARALAEATHELVAQHPGLPLERGHRVFTAQCASCHQPDGRGTTNAIPPLAGHVPSLLRAPGGRAYLASLVLYGASGSVRVLGHTYLNQMPALGALLTDDDIAAVLAYASLAWGNEQATAEAPLVSATDVAKARTQPVRPKETLSRRPALP